MADVDGLRFWAIVHRKTCMLEFCSGHSKAGPYKAGELPSQPKHQLYDGQAPASGPATTPRPLEPPFPSSRLLARAHSVLVVVAPSASRRRARLVLLLLLVCCCEFRTWLGPACLLIHLPAETAIPPARPPARSLVGRPLHPIAQLKSRESEPGESDCSCAAEL